MKKNTALVLILSLLFIVVYTITLFGLGKGFSSENAAWFQYFTSNKHNDNRENLANHNYPFNLMLSAEPNAIFMTEGGDNQVFSLLYFALVENLRPDIDFFDQKGNVFPRLYGDLFKTKREDINMIRAIRDFQLFSTDRPVYLTWPREEIEMLTPKNIIASKEKISEFLRQRNPNAEQIFNKRFEVETIADLQRTADSMVSLSVYPQKLRSGGLLSEQDFKYLGPWYLKPFGIVFRVTAIRYAIVDALMEEGQPGNYFRISSFIRDKHKIDISPEDWDAYIAELGEEGYIREEADGEIVGLRPFQPFNTLSDEDFWNAYTRAYLDIENSEHWERLAVDIFADYGKLEQDSLQRRIRQSQAELSSPQADAEKRSEILKAISAKRTMADEMANLHNPYLQVLPDRLLDYAKKQLDKGQILEANENLRKANAESYWYVYPLILGTEKLIDKAFQEGNESENFARYIKLSRENIEKALENKRIYYNFFPESGVFKNDKDIARLNFLRKSLDTLEKTDINELKSKRDGLDFQDEKEVTALAKVYNQLLQESDLFSLYQQAIDSQPNNLDVYLNFFSIVEKENPNLAINIIGRITNDYERFASAGKPLPPEWSFSFSSGILQYRILSELFRQQGDSQAARLLIMAETAKKSLADYLSNAQEYKDNKGIRKRIVLAEKRQQEILRAIAQLEQSLEQSSASESSGEESFLLQNPPDASR